MSTRLRELVERLGGQLIGDPEVEISGIAPLDSAGAAHITFLSNPKLRSQAAATKAAAIIITPADSAFLGESATARIVTDNPYAYFAWTAQFFAEKNAIPLMTGIHSTAVVDSTANVSATAMIGPQVVV